MWRRDEVRTSRKYKGVNFNAHTDKMSAMFHSLFPKQGDTIRVFSDCKRYLPCHYYNCGNCHLPHGHASHRIRGRREGHYCEVCTAAVGLNNTHPALYCRLEDKLQDESLKMAKAFADRTRERSPITYTPHRQEKSQAGKIKK